MSATLAAESTRSNELYNHDPVRGTGVVITQRVADGLERSSAGGKGADVEVAAATSDPLVPQKPLALLILSA